MSILPGWLTGQDDAEAAAAKNAALYNQYGIDTTNLYGDYKTGATGALTGAKTAATGALTTGLGNTLSALGSGLSGATAAGQAGVAAWDPLKSAVAGYDPAIAAYYKSLGLQGPGGTAEAEQYFRNQPGYQFQQDEAARAIAANASKLGISASGNTLQALGDRSQNIANTTWNDYLTRLSAFVPLQQSGATALGQGLTGANKTLADIYSQGYGAIAGANEANATQQAGLESGYGSDITNMLGNVTAGRTQTLKDITAGNAASNAAIAQAGQTDASNLWGLLGAGVRGIGSAFAPARA